MTATPDRTPTDAEIADLAHAIWLHEGRPEGRAGEHWQRARSMLERGETDPAHAPRPVQPGFRDAAPGMVPEEKPASGDELREDPGGRFAKQLAELPEEPEDMPGPRDPAPLPPTGGDGYVAIPSEDEAAAGALAETPDPGPDGVGRPVRLRRRKAAP